ncbi:hypothetical protein W97_07336 [Coniosporium apollinis CBS 100218]|uniref:Uncharacterized protein n=1 Tax=Coniosporium apollinis (strain CBS 100218) TaxID=1168221 RepID=R7Z208_CONA1|nr:uncharacterized protein W97_07336 [Coniosporium apollinis CBS 100218]EON68187.1 hypothetical protein W97_07336 [Coniosporium apollinis CBS 100218]
MATATPRREPHTEFRDVTAHTAKCDVCNQKNKQILKRCLTCSWGICTPCSRDRGDNLTHGAASGASYPRPTPIPKPPTPAPKAEDIEAFDLTSETSQSTQASATTRGKGKSRATASSTQAAATQHKRKARTIIDSEDEDGPSETPFASGFTSRSSYASKDINSAKDCRDDPQVSYEESGGEEHARRGLELCHNEPSSLAA